MLSQFGNILELIFDERVMPKESVKVRYGVLLFHIFICRTIDKADCQDVNDYLIASIPSCNICVNSPILSFLLCRFHYIDIIIPEHSNILDGGFMFMRTLEIAIILLALSSQ